MEDLNVIPATYQELQDQIARLTELNKSLTERYDTQVRVTESARQVNADFANMINPLLAYFQEQILGSSEFRDAISGYLDDFTSDRAFTDAVNDAVTDCLDNASIEINTRR